MIALLVPSRGRQKQFSRMCDSVEATARKNTVYIFSGTNGTSLSTYTDFKFPEDISTVYMWNQLAIKAMRSTDIKLFMLAADDTIFATPGWSEALIDAYDKLTNKIHVFALQDSRDAEGVPHPIFTREWIEAMGWMIPPYFFHWKIDTWSVEIAKANNCFTHMKDYLLIHDKANDRGIPDETHLRIRENGWLERDMHLAQVCPYVLEYEKKRLMEHINA